MTLTILLRTTIQKNLKNKKDCMSFIEFAYNTSIHSTTNYFSFENVYDFDHLTHLDLFHLPIDERVSFKSNKKI